MHRKIVFWGLLLLMGCQQQAGSDEKENLPPLETPPSYLSFRVNFPVSELEDGVNRMLPTVIMDDVLPIKGKDTLFLTVRRKGQVDMTIRKREVFATIPLEVSAAVKKKVLGMTFSNEDSPITFTGHLTASAKVEIDDEWNMDITCQYRGFDLGDSPAISFMGMTFNIDGTVEQVLEDNQDELSDLICGALNGALDFRQTVEKIWLDLQNPQRIARNPEKIWLYSAPIALNGQLIPMPKDTLCVHVEYRTAIHISPVKKVVNDKVPLGGRGAPLNTKSALIAYPELRMPYDFFTAGLKTELLGQTFTYEGYNVKIKDVAVGRRGQRLLVTVVTGGDIKGKVEVTGVPSLNEERELVLEDLKYEIDADDDWVAATDWAVHEFAEAYIQDKARLDTKPFLNGLDSIIMAGLGKSRLSPKIDVQVGFDEVNSYQLRLTDSALQWIFYVEGRAELTLKKGLFKKTPEPSS